MKLTNTIASLATVALLVAPAAAEDEPSVFTGGIFTAMGLSSMLATDKTIGVEIHDQATGGCWTKLGEARTYAEDSMREAGWRVDEEDANFWLSVSVLGWRTGGGCSGYVSVRMYHIVKSELLGVPVFSEVVKSAALATNYTNLNNTTLNQVGKVTKALRDLPDASWLDTSSMDAPAPTEHEL